MPTVIPYATTLQAAKATEEILSRWRDGTLAAEGKLLVSQLHLISGYGLSVYPGSPGDISPIIPIGGQGDEESLTLSEAESRIRLVVQNGGQLPVQGGGSWLTVAIRVALRTAVNGLEEPLRSIVLSMIEKMF